jgi:hypothetical protein
MKRNVWVLMLLTGLLACNDSNSKYDGGEKDPAVTQPPSENLPDSVKLVNDSVIVPDTTPGNGKQAGNSDSIQRR